MTDDDDERAGKDGEREGADEAPRAAERPAKKRGLDARSYAVIFVSVVSAALIFGWGYARRSRAPAPDRPEPPPSAHPIATTSEGLPELVATQVSPPSPERSALGAAVRTRTGDLRVLCWEKSEGPRPGARMRLRLTVDPSGKVAEVQAKTDDPTLGRCVEAAAREWTFERPAGGGPEVFEIPLRFVRSGPALPSAAASGPRPPPP